MARGAPGPVRRWLLRIGLAVPALLAALIALVAISGWTSFGATPHGARQARIERSPQWREGRFANPQHNWLSRGGALWRALFGPAVIAKQPNRPIPVAHAGKAMFAAPPSRALGITWFGHSSALVEIDGKRVLIDPIWSARASPLSWAGPARWFAPPLGLADLPPVDAVVISHDHYDHLDRATIQALAKTRARFVVPLGIGAHLAYWGVPDSRIVELDWWQTARLGDLRITATPARHASGRVSTSSNRTLWAGYALTGPRHRVWYSGDTGFHRDLARIGRELGPFDVTLIEAGQYDPAWPDNHLGPELAVEAHRLVRGKLLLPMHWALFSLAPHGWTEPVERVLAAARCRGVSVTIPRPWQRFEPARAAPDARWWPSLPWQSAAQKPVLSTIDGSAQGRFTVPPCATSAS